MALIVVGVIIAMSIILGAEQGPKADPTSTTYVPRPEWYFFFLFEVLRVIKPPELVPIATIGIPTICMVLLLLLPFYDRGPERRPERPADRDHRRHPDDRRDGLPDLPGAIGGLADRDRHESRAALRGRQGGRRRLRLPRLPQARRERQQRPGPGTDPHRARGSRARRSSARWKSARVSCPPSATCRRRSSTSSPTSSPRSTKPSRDSAQFAEQVNRMFDRVAARYDVLNSVMTAGLHHRWRERAADRAELGPGDSALDVCCGTGDLALELARPRRSRRPRGRLRLLRADARPGAREGSRERAPTGVRFEWADALQLPYDAGRFDAVTVGFGVRNLADLDRGLREMARVLRPGGRLVILEITQPQPPAALDLLLALVRPRRAAARQPLRRPRGLRLPARVGAQLPRPAPPGGEDGRSRPRAASATRSSPAGSSRSTAASAGDPPLGRTAAGDGGPRRLEPLAAGAPRRGRGSAARSERTGTASRSPQTPARRWRRAASACGRCWSCSAPAPEGADAAVRAATAIELVHMATLVHDDVLDDAPLRRGRPTVAATSGRERATAAGDLLFSRAFALLAEAGDERAVELLAEASVALARGELAQRQDAFDAGISEAALPRALPAEDGEAVRVRLPAWPRCHARSLAGAAELAEFGSGVGLAFQLLDDVLDVAGPARAHRQGARHRPARRHRHPAADRGRRASIPSFARVDLRELDAASAEALCDRIAATGALDRGPLPRPGDGRRRRSSASPRRPSTPSSATCSSSSPTASSSATADGSRRR